jgi:uncharacterized OB-fold protein
MAESMPRPIPDQGDLLTEPYWQHLREGTFALPRCDACGRHHFYPRSRCPHCGGDRIAWSAVSGRGKVYSYSVVHRAPSAAFKDEVPYVVAIVETDEGPHLMSRVVGVAPDAVRVGMRLQVRLDRAAEQAAMPVFEPEPTG